MGRKKTPAISKPEKAYEIDRVSARWAARWDRGPLTIDEERDFQAWLAGDTRRLGAFAKARAVLARTERAAALGAQYDPAEFMPDTHFVGSRFGRRQFLWLGAMAVTVMIAVGVRFLLGPAQYSTERGEMRRVALDDGSVVTLNTASKITVAFSPERRTVRLVSGEALFDVFKDASRPFIVDAGDTRVQAIGTRFAVRRLGREPMEVLVQEGVVEVTRLAVFPIAPVRLEANTRARVKTGGAPDAIAAESLMPGEAARALLWREGMIAFEASTLREAAKEFARYTDKRLVIDDVNVANETVTGLYSAYDPAGFATAVAISLGLHVEIRPNEVRLYP